MLFTFCRYIRMYVVDCVSAYFTLTLVHSALPIQQLLHVPTPPPTSYKPQYVEVCRKNATQHVMYMIHESENCTVLAKKDMPAELSSLVALTRKNSHLAALITIALGVLCCSERIMMCRYVNLCVLYMPVTFACKIAVKKMLHGHKYMLFSC